ncbi:ATP-binding cassette domain-containing protein [Bifidobacterium platyrrhinorum]|uniref:ATP-binding cassette domain-containing protein n=1 Tax=Bifidobacterium platyrrhinorum TaxID=2661628 RepID=A0A6L9STT5_9BIFI|nr:ABC transporter ATP-binding protein [Bifidobacterium platyrrhinorum]NEG55990.1 ATP-binding cassette domain-containing protein [Bifidobacterium platyrrhinorum]
MSLIINDLTKTFHKASAPALDHVNLTLEPGIHGLFGRNGAGKSTLLATIANRILPTSGDVELDGEDVRDNEHAQARIHLVNETLPFLFGMRVSSFLKREGRYCGGIDGEAAARMLAAFGIKENASYGGLSLGQRQIVRLVAGLCLPVDVLLLDEPVNGLDAANRERFYRLLIASFAERPRVIVVSTHIIDEVAQVVERAVILDHGRVVDAFDAGDVASRATVLVGDETRVNAFVDAEGLQPVAVERMGRLATVTVRGHVDERDAPDGIAVSGLGLQDYFIRVTGDGGTTGKMTGAGGAEDFAGNAATAGATATGGDRDA